MDRMFEFAGRYLKLSAEEKRLIEGANQVRRFGKGSLITDLGLSCFVLEGCLGAYSSDEAGRETVADIFLEGEPVILAPGARNGGAEAFHLRCFEDSALAVSSPADVERLVLEFPRFESACRRFAEEKLAFSLELANALKKLTPEDRYEFLRARRPDLVRRAPQHALAGYLGLTPSTLSRVRKRLSARRA